MKPSSSSRIKPGTATGALPEALAKRFEIELNAEVKKVEIMPDGRGAKVVYQKDGSET